MSIDDPLQVFFAFFRSSWPALDCAEEPREPFDILLGPSGSLLALPVFNLCLFVRGQLVVALLDGLGSLFPQSLRFPLFLLLDWPRQWRAGF